MKCPSCDKMVTDDGLIDHMHKCLPGTDKTYPAKKEVDLLILKELREISQTLKEVE